MKKIIIIMIPRKHLKKEKEAEEGIFPTIQLNTIHKVQHLCSWKVEGKRDAGKQYYLSIPLPIYLSHGSPLYIRRMSNSSTQMGALWTVATSRTGHISLHPH